MSNQTSQKGNLVLYVARISLILLLITACVAAALAGVNAITAPKIAENTARKTQEAIEAVLPGGGEEVDFVDNTGLVSVVYKGESGYAVQVAPMGFNGAITMMVGVDFEGNILGISVISQAETAGLGAVCAEKTSKGEEFRGQYVGMSGTLAVDKDGGEVASITGATISSRAVTAGINAALECVANMG